MRTEDTRGPGAVDAPSARHDAVAAALRDDGFARLELPGLPWRSLRDEAMALRDAGALRPAATGRRAGRRAGALRGDATAWIDPATCGPATTRWLAGMDALRIALNRRLLLGLEELEAHFACYPPGAGYARHRDRFADDDARVVSLACYLNPDWPADAGGTLRLYLGEGHRDIAPALGTCVLFLSEDIEHEVLPATRERWSIAGWFRRRAC
jgi:SM-20-related protein